jgi:hypothetical protein
MGPTALLPLRRKACCWFFRPKQPTASVGCEPADLGTKGQHPTSRPPKPLCTEHTANATQSSIVNWALLGYYATSSGISYSRFGKTNGPIFKENCWHEMSVINYHYSLRNDPEERSSHLLCGESLKSRTKPHTVCCSINMYILFN